MLKELLQHDNIEIRQLNVIRRHPPPERTDVLEQPPHRQRRIAPPQQRFPIRLDERAHPTRSSSCSCHVHNLPAEATHPDPGRLHRRNYPNNRNPPTQVSLTTARPSWDSRGVGIDR